MTKIVYGGVEFTSTDGLSEIVKQVESALNNPGQEGGPWLTASHGGNDFRLLITQGVPVAVGF